MISEEPIGLFDSGVGGLTIMREVVKHLPNENIVYFGDTARLPYGNKSADAVIRFCLESVSFLIERKIKLLIVACFTASSHVLEILEQKLSIPVIGVIQSGVDELMAATRSKRVAILGTASTIDSGVLQSSIQKREPASVLFPLACPLFVPLIEEGLIEHPATRMIATHYLDPLREANIDSALLACTHYPLIRSLIQDALGSEVRLIEPARSCALKAKQWLSNYGLLNRQTTAPIHEFYASGDPEKFCRLTHLFFGSEIKPQSPIFNC